MAIRLTYNYKSKLYKTASEYKSPMIDTDANEQIEGTAKSIIVNVDNYVRATTSAHFVGMMNMARSVDE